MNYRSINSEVFEFTDMPVCFGTRLCKYRIEVGLMSQSLTNFSYHLVASDLHRY